MKTLDIIFMVLVVLFAIGLVLIHPLFFIGCCLVYELTSIADMVIDEIAERKKFQQNNKRGS